jgi:hypothetical protein
MMAPLVRLSGLDPGFHHTIFGAVCLVVGTAAAVGALRSPWCRHAALNEEQAAVDGDPPRRIEDLLRVASYVLGPLAALYLTRFCLDVYAPKHAGRLLEASLIVGGLIACFRRGRAWAHHAAFAVLFAGILASETIVLRVGSSWGVAAPTEWVGKVAGPKRPVATYLAAFSAVDPRRLNLPCAGATSDCPSPALTDEDAILAETIRLLTANDPCARCSPVLQRAHAALRATNLSPETLLRALSLDRTHPFRAEARRAASRVARRPHSPELR